MLNDGKESYYVRSKENLYDKTDANWLANEIIDLLNFLIYE